MTETTEYRFPGTRNFIRAGDLVRVAKAGADRSGFDARVQRFVLDGDQVSYVDVVVVGGPRRGTFRSVRPERIQRKAQTRNGERVERR